MRIVDMPFCGNLRSQKDYYKIPMSILGAIVGDIVGSIYEFDNIKTKDFKLLTRENYFTDDTVMTLAVYDVIKKNCIDGKVYLTDLDLISSMKELGRKYPYCGYGDRFGEWVMRDGTKPYNSYGNGSAMRVSSAGHFATDIKHAEELGEFTAKVTHNHPEGIKGAKCVASLIYIAYNYPMSYVKDYCKKYYDINFTLDQIRDTYEFNETCQDTVPQAVVAFLESNSFESAIRNAISIGGDSDTIAAITGSIAGAYYGVPYKIGSKAMRYLTKELREILCN